MDDLKVVAIVSLAAYISFEQFKLAIAEYANYADAYYNLWRIFMIP
jgi:hypothetical protein